MAIQFDRPYAEMLQGAPSVPARAKFIQDQLVAPSAEGQEFLGLSPELRGRVYSFCEDERLLWILQEDEARAHCYHLRFWEPTVELAHLDESGYFTVESIQALLQLLGPGRWELESIDEESGAAHFRRA